MAFRHHIDLIESIHDGHIPGEEMLAGETNKYIFDSGEILWIDGKGYCKRIEI